MASQVVSGAQLQCSFGTTPSSLSVLPTKRVNAEGKPAANIMDHQAMVNVSSFGMCSSLANPAVAAATAAASGVLTPQSCVPVVPAPWVPGAATVFIGGTPALNNSSTCMCAWAGVISVTDAGTTKTMVP